MRLKGAVPDARAVCKWVRSTFHVPEYNIRTLEDGQATRVNIINALTALSTDPNITENDAILIYYAGHGASIPCPPDWESEFIDGQRSRIQAILPQDVKKDVDDEPIYCIPDRTIGALLNKIADQKGDNIVRVCPYQSTRAFTNTSLRLLFSTVAMPDRALVRKKPTLLG